MNSFDTKNMEVSETYFTSAENVQPTSSEDSSTIIQRYNFL